MQRNQRRCLIVTVGSLKTDTRRGISRIKSFPPSKTRFAANFRLAWLVTYIDKDFIEWNKDYRRALSEDGMKLFEIWGEVSSRCEKSFCGLRRQNPTPSIKFTTSITFEIL